MSDNEAVLAGTVMALKLLVAHALAIALREHQDPRGTLNEVLMALEQQIGDSSADLPDALRGQDLSAVFHHARSSVLFVGEIADSLLRHMGAPPAPGS